MTIALTITPASGSVVHAKSATNVAVTGAAANTLTGYDPAVYPASPQVEYYVKAALSGQDDLKSYQFAVDSDGGHIYQDLIFPAAGTWTVTLNAAADDSVAATLAVEVS